MSVAAPARTGLSVQRAEGVTMTEEAHWSGGPGQHRARQGHGDTDGRGPFQKGQSAANLLGALAAKPIAGAGGAGGGGSSLRPRGRAARRADGDWRRRQLVNCRNHSCSFLLRPAAASALWSALALRSQARAVDVSSYLEIFKRNQQFERRLKASISSGEEWLFSRREYLNFLEGLAHLYIDRRFGEWDNRPLQGYAIQWHSCH